MTMEKEEYSALIAAKAEKALTILKITVICTAVLAILLPVISIVLLLTADKAIYGIAGLCISLGIFIAMLIVLVCVVFYVRKQLKILKSLDAKDENAD